MQLLKSLGEKVAFHKQRPHRMEALSDGVFAIVMTLLVLDIHVPLINLTTEHGLWKSLVDIAPKILTFILSFSLAGQFWSVFTNQFNYIQTSDRNGNIIAIFYLLFVSLLPFSTAFLSEHFWSKVAVGFYVVNILLIILLATLHWLYSYHAGLVRLEGSSGIVIHRAIMKLAKAALISYGIVAGLCFFNSYLALTGAILLQVMFTFVGLFEIVFSASKAKLKIFKKGI